MRFPSISVGGVSQIEVCNPSGTIDLSLDKHGANMERFTQIDLKPVVGAVGCFCAPAKSSFTIKATKTGLGIERKLR